MSLCCTVGYMWVTVMDSLKFEFNDNTRYMRLLCKKNDTERIVALIILCCTLVFLYYQVDVVIFIKKFSL